MFFNRSTMIVLAAILTASGGIVLMGQDSAGSQNKSGEKIKKVTIKYSKPESGAQMFKDYCAACHGVSGSGDGPAAEFLKSQPADLSLLAKQNNGKFPAQHFTSVLQLGSTGHAHGSSEMPVWGPLFRSLDAQQRNLVELRIHNLSEFVESLQKK